MFYLGLLAAAQRVPFLPTRAGLGSDVLKVNPDIRTVTSPYPGPFGEHEELVAVPALRLDAAFVHMNRADRHGNAQFLGPDPYFDDVFLGAADARYVTAERIVEPGALLDEGPIHSVIVNRMLTDACSRGARRGALHDLRAGLRTGRGVPARIRQGRRICPTWAEFRIRYLEVNEDEYRSATQATGR